MYKVGFFMPHVAFTFILYIFLFSETNILFGINISTNFSCFFDLINKIFYSFKKLFYLSF